LIHDPDVGVKCTWYGAVMRIAILADIHGNVLALEAVLADLEHRSVDQFVNLGDCVSGPLWPRETAELLRQLNWPTVRGNHDRWVTDWPPEKHYREDAFAFQSLDISELAWLRALPSTRELSDGVFACHGRPDDDNAYLLENVEGGRLVPARRTEVAERVHAVASRFVLCAQSYSRCGDHWRQDDHQSGQRGIAGVRGSVAARTCFGIRQPGCPLRRAAAQWGADEF
jgi:predicted phosphodiesterase